jgi:hypothetical protein
MKKNMHFLRLVVMLLLIGNTAFSQTNYFGVTGNMVSGDFDNDGKLDDIAAFNTASELPQLMLWTNENGWINEQTANCKLPFDFLSPQSMNAKIVTGDFDNDGFLDDIASIYEIGQNQTSLTVWLNNQGVFSPSRWWFGGDFDANQTQQTIVSGDFDHDGFVDDIAAFYNYEQEKTKVYVWLSDSKQFAWPGTWWIGTDFNSTRIQGTMVSGDFDHDGYQDDIAALYDYADNYCKAFVWTTENKTFNWPYTWFTEADFAAGKAKGNIVSGDFDGNGFMDNLAALFENDENSSTVLVFKHDKKAFAKPEIWWYGQGEAQTANMRLVAGDFNNNNQINQFAGLLIDGTEAKLTAWTAENNQFTTPEELWQGIALSAEDCENNGGCLPNELAESFKIYPNPSQGQFTLEIPNVNNGAVTLNIYTILGAQVYQNKVQSGSIMPLDLPELKTGNYMIQITGTDFTLNQNLIIQ